MPYFLPEGYQPRYGATQDFIGENRVTDNCQKATYIAARKLADLHKYKRIGDVGAGGGYKLVHYFKGFDKIGFDLPEGVELLKKKYPGEADWRVTDGFDETVDLVICSDVIEHVDDPDSLCEFIKSLKPKHVVISTPDRQMVVERYEQPPLGPPRNTTHVMEWDYEEFPLYMAQHFDIEDFFYSDERECTMCMIGKPKC